MTGDLTHSPCFSTKTCILSERPVPLLSDWTAEVPLCVWTTPPPPKHADPAELSRLLPACGLKAKADSHGGAYVSQLSSFCCWRRMVSKIIMKDNKWGPLGQLGASGIGTQLFKKSSCFGGGPQGGKDSHVGRIHSSLIKKWLYIIFSSQKCWN